MDTIELEEASRVFPYELSRMAQNVVIRAMCDLVVSTKEGVTSYSRWCAKQARELKEDARKFIESEDLDVWCGIAGLNPDVVRERANDPDFMGGEDATRRIRATLACVGRGNKSGRKRIKVS